MRRFGTQGPVNPQEHYVVSRTEEIADFLTRVEEGKYIVLFAPRQTGKTTFFQAALETLAVGNAATAQAESATDLPYFPIQLNFDVYKNTSIADFYANLYQDIVDFNLRSDVINELATYGVIARGEDGMCEIVNPMYLYCILQAFKPVVNGLEDEYLPEGTHEGFLDYLTSTGQVDMVSLLDNFRDFIARAGFRILQVPDTRHKNRLADISCWHILISLLESSAVLCILKCKPVAVGWTSLSSITSKNTS